MQNTIPSKSGYLLDEADAESFWSRVNFQGGLAYLQDNLVDHAKVSGECWLWRGKNNGNDDHCYGRFKLYGKLVPAHRIAYRDFGSRLADSKYIDHLCRVTLCVNPAHLEAVTPKENVLRGAHHRNKAETCRSGHPYTTENTRVVLNALGAETRHCIECRRRYAREGYQRRKQAA